MSIIETKVDMPDLRKDIISRRQFFNYAHEELKKAEAYGTYFQYSIVYTNIRNFKYYNVRYGMQAGDEVLRWCAERITANHEDDIKARFSNDHFVVLTKRNDLDDLATEFCTEFNKQFADFGIKFKVGIYKISSTANSLETACDLAAFACDSIKNDKKSIFYYNEKIQHELEVESYVLQNFEHMLRSDAVEVYYQPIIRTINGCLCSLEALVRLRKEDGTYMSPVDVIPVLEKHLLITKLDLNVLHQVCRQIRSNQEFGFVNVPVSINLSRLDFTAANIFEEVESAVAEYGIARDMLCIEITESMVMDDQRLFQREIARFKAAGYQVWMDDFGSGYSSLNVLDDYAFDEIKLDQKFLRHFDARGKKVIRSIVSMAKELDIATLAEGVETREQFEFLREIGCEKAQGYYFSRPVEFKRIEEMYADRKDKIEKRLWRNYFSQVGKINFITDKAFVISEFDGTNFELIFANEAYRKIWDSVGIENLEIVRDMINSPASPLHARYLEPIRKFEAGETDAAIEYAVNGYYMRLDVKVLAKEQGHMLLRGEIVNLSYKEKRTDLIDNIFRMMYGMYDSVQILDLDSNWFEPVMEGSSFSRLSNDGFFDKNMMADVGLLADAIIHRGDRKEFAKFLNKEDLLERLKGEDKNYITNIYRTKSKNNSYLWALHTLLLITGTHKVIYSIRYVPRLYDELQNKMLTEIQKEERNKNIWQTVYNSQILNFFWKDLDRRFVGVNARFLDTYGFKSPDEVLGKTDEDMRWHIDGAQFREDELTVLREGKAVHNRFGKCIIRGVVHNILVSKEPVFENGKVVGLVGSFINLDDIGATVYQSDYNSEKDTLTELLSGEAAVELAREYLEAWEYHQKKFAVITFDFDNYERSQQTYGHNITRIIVRKIGDLLLEESLPGVEVGRLHTSKFIMLLHYDEKREVEWLPKDIEQRCSEVHKLAGYEVTLNPKINIYYAEDADDAYDMLHRAIGGHHFSRKMHQHVSTNKSMDILSRIPAGVAVFSRSPKNELKRLYLSEQARIYAHIGASGNDSLEELVSIIHLDDRRRVYNTILAHLSEKEPELDLEFRVIGEDGKTYWDRLTLKSYQQKDGSHLIYGVYTDITEGKLQSEAYKVLSYTDGLTGLRNRHCLREDYNHLIGKQVTMLMADIDKFKEFNDEFGHDMGDKALVTCSALLKKHFKGVWGYRYGGDEFLLIGVDEQPETLQNMMNNFKQELERTKLGIGVPPVEVSYGILSGIPRSKDDVQRIFKEADDLLYEVKEERQNSRKNSGGGHTFKRF